MLVQCALRMAGGIPIYLEGTDFEALMSFAPAALRSGAEIGSATIKSLAGSGMCLPAVGSLMLLTITCTPIAELQVATVALQG